ncbi:hypothetical protein J6590_029807 [Homalodisca vitripennis]|nr:hypothetical protein J6590_029807 [Homalodisca vitripennis]
MDVLMIVFPASRSFHSMISPRAVIVERPGIKPCCPSRIISFCWRCALSLLKTTLSETLENAGSKEIDGNIPCARDLLIMPVKGTSSSSSHSFMILEEMSSTPAEEDGLVAMMMAQTSFFVVGANTLR